MSDDNLVPQPDDSILRAVSSAIGDETTAGNIVRDPLATKQYLDAAEQASANAPSVEEQARQIAADHQEGKVTLKAVDDIGRATAADVQEALHQVIDPELGIDVMDLGLVYGIEIDELGRAIITMTLTTPACPLTDLIEDECATVLAGLVEEFRVDWTWTPAWSIDMITPEGAEQLAALGFDPNNLPRAYGGYGA